MEFDRIRRAIMLLEFQIRCRGWILSVPFDNKMILYQLTRASFRVRCVILKTERLLKSIVARQQSKRLNAEATMTSDGTRRRQLRAKAARQRRVAAENESKIVPRGVKIYKKDPYNVPDTYWGINGASPRDGIIRATTREQNARIARRKLTATFQSDWLGDARERTRLACPGMPRRVKSTRAAATHEIDDTCKARTTIGM
jgi:hypothetical protein